MIFEALLGERPLQMAEVLPNPVSFVLSAATYEGLDKAVARIAVRLKRILELGQEFIDRLNRAG